MTDTAVGFSSNALLFAELLASSAEGHALWDPRLEVGHVGDCGYISGGRFIKFFNVFHPVDSKWPADIPTADGTAFDPNEIYEVVRVNTELPLKSPHLRSLAFDEGRVLLEGEPSSLFPVKFTLGAARPKDGRVAYLGFCGRQRTVYSYDKTVLLESFLAKHGPEIRKAFASSPVELQDIIIVYEATVVDSWVNGISSITIDELSANGSDGPGGTKEVPTNASDWIISTPPQTSAPKGGGLATDIDPGRSGSSKMTSTVTDTVLSKSATHSESVSQEAVKPRKGYPIVLKYVTYEKGPAQPRLSKAIIAMFKKLSPSTGGPSPSLRKLPQAGPRPSPGGDTQSVQ